MNPKNPTGTVLYLIEQAIKEYRKLSQNNISRVIEDITIDQCLILIILNDNSTSSQKEIAELIFKDHASITRMIDLMVKKDYLIRSLDQSDRRKFDLRITDKGKNALELLTPKIKENRKNALKGLSKTEIEQFSKILQKIILNCKSYK